MATVRLEHVWKRFGNDVIAVRDVSLEAREGEFLVFVGPSGCGKSTALRMIAGLEEISGGDIYIDDRRVNDVPARDRDIAMVFQNYALYPHMTVADNMAFALKMRGVPKAEIRQRVEHAADILGIKPLLNRRPKQLSGGQRQRVALGRAIVREPKAFLMDEPLSNLDAKLRVQTRAEIVKLQKRLGTTTIYVTHDQVEAMTMGHRIAILREGMLQQIDTPRRLFDRPVNAFVAGFIGSPAMNLVTMRVTGTEGGGVALERGDLRIDPPPRHAHALRAYRDREIIVGIRPDALTDHRSPDEHAVQVPATVEVVELLGSEAYLYAQVAGQSMIARVAPSFDPSPGAPIRLWANLDAMHLFDPETETSVIEGTTSIRA
ncbi:MAG: ABC transporter ATP-binding protein [Dehalococcoidia bacterium]